MTGFINVSDLNGLNGFVIEGKNPGDNLFRVSHAGDLNQDGIDDFILGASGVDVGNTLNQGRVYGIYGSESGFGESFDLASLNGDNGFIVNGVASNAGAGVANAGDVNGDGLTDILIGSVSQNVSGRVDMLFGAVGGFPAVINLEPRSEPDNASGIRIFSDGTFDGIGIALSGGGDINGDGQDDIVIGAPGRGNNYRQSGRTFTLFNSSDDPDFGYYLNQLNGQVGIQFGQEDQSLKGRIGTSVATGGDLNGDGLADVIIGEPFANSDNSEAVGVVHVVFGSSDYYEKLVTPDSLDGSSGFTIVGSDANGLAGISVAFAGDINGDGYDDLIIGASQAGDGGDQRGETYVLFGRSARFANTQEVSKLNGGNGFSISGISGGDNSGYSVAAAGDVNGDGIDDIIIGAPNADPNGQTDAGQAYVIFGSEDGFSAHLDLADLDGTNGFAINGINPGDALGSQVSAAGDINGDGYDDLLIGSLAGEHLMHGRTEREPEGAVYVIYGAVNIGLQGVRSVSTGDDDETLMGTAGQDTIMGGQGADSIIGADENDELSGGGNDDDINGGDGSDTLDGGDGDDTLFGGNQPDVLMGGNGKDILRGSNGSDTLSGGTAFDDLSGGNGNDLLQGDGAGDRLRGDPGADTLDGGAGITDQAYYFFSDAPVNVDLEAGTASGGFAEGDVLLNIESVVGSTGNDTLVGQSGGGRLAGAGGDDLLIGREGRDRIEGGNGNDTLVGSEGADIMNGGRGTDLVDYSASDAAVTVNMLTRSGSGGHAEGDTIAAIQNVLGSDFADTIIGNSAPNRFDGGAGNDTLTGGAGEDVFLFQAGHGNDVVTDFTVGEDLLVFEVTSDQGGDPSDAIGTAVDTEVNGQTGALIDTGGGNSIFLVGVSAQDLTQESLGV